MRWGINYKACYHNETISNVEMILATRNHTAGTPLYFVWEFSSGAANAFRKCRAQSLIISVHTLTAIYFLSFTANSNVKIIKLSRDYSHYFYVTLLFAQK